jgi:hypothetical protein
MFSPAPEAKHSTLMDAFKEGALMRDTTQQLALPMCQSKLFRRQAEVRRKGMRAVEILLPERSSRAQPDQETRTQSSACHDQTLVFPSLYASKASARRDP